jgi:hypothetical protein
VQVYRSADGELLVETTLQDEELPGNYVLFAGDVRLDLQRYALPRFEAVFNPGAPFEVVGMLALFIAIFGHYRLSHAISAQPVEEESDDENSSTDLTKL